MVKKKNTDLEKHVEIITDKYTIIIDRNNEEQCMIDNLLINDKSFYVFDLGYTNDIDPDNAPACGCGNRIFIPEHNSYIRIQKQTNLPEETCKEIVEKLTEVLSIGYCKRCH